MKKVKNIRLHPSPDLLNELLSTCHWEERKKNLLNSSGTMGKWIFHYITDVSAFCLKSLLIVKKKQKQTELHLQAQRDLLHYCLLLITKIIHNILPLIKLS